MIILKHVTALTMRKQGQLLVSNIVQSSEKRAAAREQYSTNPETKRQSLVSNIVLIQRPKRQPLVNNIVLIQRPKR